MKFSIYNKILAHHRRSKMQVVKLYIYTVCVLIVFVTSGILWKINYDIKKLLVFKAKIYKQTYAVDTLNSSDYQHLINLENFTFTIINECGNSSLLLLVLIHSHPNNFDKRQAIRRTWGQNNETVKTLFMTAFIEDAKIEEKLCEENKKYGDLVQGSFTENYKNLTYKHVMLFKYAIYHCPQAQYILKSDDDVFVNMPLMMYFLQMNFLAYGGSKMLACALMYGNPAIREESKWKVTFEEYSDRLYPTHCSGFVILYSSDVVFQLYKEAQRTKYFWIDDVHITGVIAKKANITQLDVRDLMLNQEETSNSAKIRKLFLFSDINVNIIKIEQLWSHVLRQNLYISMLHKLNSIKTKS